MVAFMVATSIAVILSAWVTMVSYESGKKQVIHE